jgi:trigger factor
MQIEVKEIESCKLSVQYTADAGEILNKRGDVITQFKKAPVPGFRPGKASLDAIQVHYKTQIDESLKRALAEDAYHNTLFEKKLRPHGAPTFNSLMLANGKFTCEFELHTKPDFELVELKDLEVVKPHEEENSVELTEKMLQELRVRMGDAAPYSDTDFVQLGDNVILDYEGSLNGEVVPHLCASGELLTVGKSNIPNFDDQILGMALNETREFDLHVPEGGLASLSGQTVHLKVTLAMGSKNTPCPLDDSLAEKMGKSNMEELRTFVQGTADATLQNKAKVKLFETIAHKLVDITSINVPNWMSLSEAKYLTHNAKLNWDILSDADKEQYLQMAEKNVKLSLILDKVRENNPEAQLTDQEIFEIIKRNLAKTQVQQPIDEVIQQMNKSGYLQILFSRIRDEHAMDFVSKLVKVVD